MSVGRAPALRRAGDLESITSALDADGAGIVEGFLPPDLLQRLNAELDSLVDEAAAGSRSDSPLWQEFHGRNTKRFTRLAARCESFWEVVRHPILRAVTDKLLLPSCGSYWLNTGQMMVIGPGESAQWLHRDQENWPLFSAAFGASGPEVTVSALIALTEFTDECGATRVVPGSHRWDDFGAFASADDTIAAEMPAGAALLYTGKVIHGGGANRTENTWRRGLHVSFVLGWLTPEEANPLSVPWSVARELPEDVQRLLGWGSYDPAPHIGGRLWTVDFDELRTTLVPELECPEP
jgi:ectoine hydroxylase-related dioxygenase (phytanoyl-CoA dioxygenase family)